MEKLYFVKVVTSNGYCINNDFFLSTSPKGAAKQARKRFGGAGAIVLDKQHQTIYADTKAAKNFYEN